MDENIKKALKAILGENGVSDALMDLVSYAYYKTLYLKPLAYGLI